MTHLAPIMANNAPFSTRQDPQNLCRTQGQLGQPDAKVTLSSTGVMAL